MGVFVQGVVPSHDDCAHSWPRPAAMAAVGSRLVFTNFVRNLMVGLLSI